MSFTIRVSGTDIRFPCAPDETVLEAAERAGFALPHSCRRGACETCTGDVSDGRFSVGLQGTPVAAPGSEVTLCRVHPRSDLEIRPRRIERKTMPERRRLSATVYRVQYPAPDVAVLHLRFPAGVRVPFKAGQYLQLETAPGERRSYSLANPPHKNDGALLHVRVIPGGAFSATLLPALEAGDTLPVELPYGDFYLRDGDQPVILAATGTGFAPMRSIIESAIRRGLERPMELYWGGRRAQDLYLADAAARWARKHPWFRFVPVLSQSESAPWDDWRAGHIDRAIMQDHADLAGHRVYACGNPEMLAGLRARLVGDRALPADEFYCDAFVATGADAGGDME